MSFVPKLLAAGDRFAISNVADLVDHLGWFAGDDQRPKLEAWLRATFGPGATKLGALPKDGDDLDAEVSRAQLFEQAAYAGRDPDLTKQAIELAGHWRELPEAMREDILTVAVDASPELQAKLREDVKTEKDIVKLGAGLSALSHVRDPHRLEQALGTMLDPAIDFRESMWMLASVDATTLAVRESFFKTHQSELFKRLPAIDDTGTSVFAFAQPFASDCDAARRDELAAYLKQTFSAIPGAPRHIVQMTEGLDRCIATHKQLDPEVRGWLGGVKIVKTAKPAKPLKSTK
jgi:cytosol alanyl aminopeptidase